MTLYEKINETISIAILCGSKSSRFGDRPKIIYKINDKFMFRILYDKFQSFTDDIFFQGSIKIEKTIQEHLEIINFENYRFIPDLIEDKGPLGGIYSALTHAKHPKLFVVAVDLPFLDGTILLELENEIKLKFVNIDVLIEQGKIDRDCFRNVNTVKDL